MNYKSCGVPRCGNTSIKTPDKLFITVPKNAKVRSKWLLLARRDPREISAKTVLFFCQEHFDLRKDLVNYYEYTMGFSKRMILGEGVVPSKFSWKKDPPNPQATTIATQDKKKSTNLSDHDKELRQYHKVLSHPKLTKSPSLTCYVEKQIGQDGSEEIQDDLEYKGDDLEYRKNDLEYIGDDLEYRKNDLEYKGDDIEYKGDDLEYKGDDIEYKGDDLEYKGDDLEYRKNGLEFKEDDVRSPSPEVEEPEIDLNMCRICLQSFSKLISIESYGLRTAYEQLTGVSVEHDDGLPRELCVECATLLDKYHKFRDKSIKGDQLLRQLYSKDQTEKIPLEEIEQAILNLACKIDFSPEVTCIDIDPEDTEYRVPESEDLTNSNTDLNKTSESNVIETDLDMSVDEPVAEEWLTLSDKDNDEHIMSPTATSVHDIDDEVSIKEEELDLDGDHTDPLDLEDVNIQQEIGNIDVGQQTKLRFRLSRLPNRPDTQVLCIDKQSEIKILSLLKQLKTRNSLVKQSERHKLSLVKHPETRHTNLVKHPETRHINLLKHREKRRITLLKQPEIQDISQLKDTETQQDKIKAYYCIQKLDIIDQKHKHIRKGMLPDYNMSAYKCEICYEGFKTEDALNSHNIHDADQGDLSCTICESRYRVPQDLKEHVEDVHQYVFSCKLCECDILTRTLALRHIEEHLPSISLIK